MPAGPSDRPTLRREWRACPATVTATPAGTLSRKCSQSQQAYPSDSHLAKTVKHRLENAIAAVWDGVPVQRCTVHKHRNLLAHAPERLHEELSADYNDMIYASTREEVEKRRKTFIRKWRLKHRAVADSLQEAGDRLFTFTRLPLGQWRSARTTNTIERLHEEFRRRIKTQTVLPSADTAAMLFWALLASGQISMRKIDGWHTLATKPIDQPIDLAA
jgi:transposase-like protein